MGFDDLDDRRRDIALFRHRVISELDVGPLPRGELSNRIAELSRQVFVLPGGDERRFSERTLWSWRSAFRRDGLLGLVPPRRADRGVPRAIGPEVLEAAIAVRQECPSRSTETVIHVLEMQGLVVPGQLKRSTLDRHMTLAGMSRRRLKTLGDKRFIRLLFQEPNQFWVGDYKVAPVLFDPRTGHFRNAHLCAFIDHYSKLVPHAQWYSNEQIATLEDTLKKALLKRGITASVYVDNGAVYRSRDFAFALAHLDIKEKHSKPYRSEGRGVIERWNRTIKEQFVPEVQLRRVTDVDQLNVLFEGWLEQRYHLRPHDATGQQPVERFAASGFKPRYPDPVLLADTFRVREKRKVHPKTSTVEICGVAFLVEEFLRGRWVRVHFDPHCLDDVLVFLDGKRVQRAFPQRPNEPPQPTPERSLPAPPAFDYLAAVRAEYDRRIVAEAKRLSLAEWAPTDSFTLPAFLEVFASMLGKDLADWERDELALAWNGVGPFSEPTCRMALEHALRLRGRGLHVSVYTHYLKVFHLEALRAGKESER